MQNNIPSNVRVRINQRIRSAAREGYVLYKANRDSRPAFEKILLRQCNLLREIGRNTYIYPKADEVISKMKSGVAQFIAACGLSEPYSKIFDALDLDHQAKFFRLIDWLTIENGLKHKLVCSKLISRLTGQNAAKMNKSLNLLDGELMEAIEHFKNRNWFLESLAKWLDISDAELNAGD